MRASCSRARPAAARHNRRSTIGRRRGASRPERSRDIGDAAVAAQHPGAILSAGLRSSALMPFAATMRPRSIGTRSSVAARRLLVHEGVEAVGVGRRNIEEEERRRFLRQRRGELAMQIAVDLDHGDQQRQAEAEREHDARRQRAGPMNVGDGEPQHGRARARQTAGDRHGQHRDQPQQRRRRRRRRRRRSRRCGGRRSVSDRERRQAAATIDRGRDDITRPRPAPLGGDLIAEQHRHRNIVRAAERPQRKGERGQQPIDDRQRQHAPDAATARPAAE